MSDTKTQVLYRALKTRAPSPTGMSLESTYDVIFAGGGTVACVAAGRLAKADPTLKILILEVGPETKDKPTHTQPARFAAHLVPGAETVRFHVDQPSEALGNRPNIIVTGQCLGGGSSVNFGMYTRGSRSDFDDWETEFKNPGWGFKDLLPLFEKTETFEVRPDAPRHGYSGPLKVSYGGTYTDIGKDFISTAGKVDVYRKSEETHDGNDFSSTNTYCRWPKWISGTTGKRSDAAHHFVYNQLGNTSLQIATGATVKRVLLEDGRATGVEFQWNSSSGSKDTTKANIVHANKLVVISGGALGSPAILERSGIGASAVLKKVGVPQLVELEGVGEGYQDHNIVFVPYIADPETESLDAIMRGEADEISMTSGEWFKSGQGRMAHNGVDAGMKCRPSAEERKQWGPDFEAKWNAEFENKPDKIAIWVGLASMLLRDPRVVPPQKYYSMGCFTAYPVARGHAHITSSDDYEAPLDFKSGFFEDMIDVLPHIWAYKHCREIGRRMSVFRGEPAPLHPKFPPGSKAALIEQGMPLPLDAPPITYTAEDDKAIEAYVRESVATCWHSLGTCAMKPKAEGGVVDSSLNVYGVKGLKVADLSICPGNVGGNTYSTALVVGEKAAVIIGEELGIKGV